MTPPTPTTITRLRLGQTVTVEHHGIADTPDPFTGTLVAIDLYNMVVRVQHEGSNLQTKLHPECVTPVLRGPNTLTDTECREVFRLAFGFAGTIRLDTYPDEVVITGTGTNLGIRLTTHTFWFRAYKRSGHSTGANWPAVIDYLDALGVAIRGGPPMRETG